MDPVFARDSRIFLGFMERDLGRDRTLQLGNLVTDRAAGMPGPASEASWFLAWAEILDEFGTGDEMASATRALLNVKKVRDAGY